MLQLPERRAQTHTVGKGSRTEAWEAGTGKKVDTGLGTERSTKGCILPLGGGGFTFLDLPKGKKKNPNKNKNKPQTHQTKRAIMPAYGTPTTVSLKSNEHESPPFSLLGLPRFQ